MREIKFRAWNKSAKVITALSRLTVLPIKTEDVSTILMQYTGLKDSKGVEIYEGDIVKVRARLDSVVGVVDFHESTFVFKIPVDDHSLASPYRDLKTGWYGIEVIGNIYESPELLND